MAKLACLLLAVWLGGACAARAQDWSWLEPGKTTRDDVVARAGEPARTGETEVAKGRLDLHPLLPGDAPGLRGLTLDPCARIAVEVLTYPAGAAAPDEPDRLVFRHGRLLYAVVQTTAAQRALPATEAEGRGKYRDVFFEVAAGEGFRRYWVSVREDRNEGFVQRERPHWNVPGPAVLRVVWAENRQFESDLAGTEWTWPVNAPARDWSWVRPGKTGRAALDERAGRPRRTRAARVVKGLVDFRFGNHLDADGAPILLNARDSRVLTVEILEYDPGDSVVLLGDRVLYLGVRPPPDSRTAAQIEEKFGRDPGVREAQVLSECVIETWTVVSYARDRVAFVGEKKSGATPEFSLRLDWAAPGDFETELAGIEWRLPSGRGWWLPAATK